MAKKTRKTITSDDKNIHTDIDFVETLLGCCKPRRKTKFISTIFSTSDLKPARLSRTVDGSFSSQLKNTVQVNSDTDGNQHAEAFFTI